MLIKFKSINQMVIKYTLSNYLFQVNKPFNFENSLMGNVFCDETIQKGTEGLFAMILQYLDMITHYIQGYENFLMSSLLNSFILLAVQKTCRENVSF